MTSLGFILDFKRLRDESFNEAMAKIFKPIMRESERDAFTGLPFYALGLGLSFLVFDRQIAELAMYYLVFADPMGSIIGIYFGKDRLFPNKTLQGTGAVFFTCYAITLGFTYTYYPDFSYHLVFAFLGATLGAASEILGAFNIDDNLTIPVVSSIGLTVMAKAFMLY